MESRQETIEIHEMELDITVQQQIVNSLLNQPLFWWRLDYVVQLQPRWGQFLGRRFVFALRFPASPGHNEEDKNAHQGDK